jgi:phage repressor protein C with HTH and peptisase S24 domain
VLAITVDEHDNENIELVPLKAAAGYALSYGDPEFIRTLPKFQLPFLKGGSFRAFEIQGDSMHPIPSGSIVIGQYIESLKDVKQDEAYIFITMHNGLLFKRVGDINKSRIFMKSDNPSYSSFSLPLSEIQEVWKTKLYMSSQFPAPDAGLGRLEQQLQQLQQDIRALRPAEA